MQDTLEIAIDPQWIPQILPAWVALNVTRQIAQRVIKPYEELGKLPKQHTKHHLSVKTLSSIPQISKFDNASQRIM
jgi:hypothetical protein